MELTKNAEHILRLRYLRKDGTGQVVESPEQMVERVVEYVGKHESIDTRQRFYNMMDSLDFLPNSPCLFNAGLPYSQLAACYVLPIGDSIDSIFTSLHQAAVIAKMGGGVGFNFSKLRPKGSLVNTTKGIASGPLSFMRLYNTMADVISQGGRRRLAQMAVLNYDHPDIEEFVHVKEDNGRYTNFNFSVLVDDEFMENPSPLFDEIVYSAWSCGEPGLLFRERINEDNPTPHLGEIVACNPCLAKDSILLDTDRLTKIFDGNAVSYKSWQTGIKDCIKLITNAGHEIILTPDHQIMLESGGFVPAKDTLNKTIKWGLGDWSCQDYDSNGVLLGFLFGDGFLCGNKIGVSVKLNKQKEPEAYDFLIGEGFHKQVCGALYMNREALNKKLYPYSIDFLEKHVWERELPEDILFSDFSFLGSFVRGLFEANGSVSRINQMSLKSTCFEMIKKIQIILGAFGIESWIVKNKSTEIKWSNGTYTSKDSYNLQIAPRNVYKFKERIGFFSNAKNDKIKNMPGLYKSKLKVTSIEPAGQKEVWDFNIDTGYNFANGIIVHNCAESPLLPYEACLAQGTWVYTSRGLMPIENVLEGDQVISKTDNNNWVFVPVLKNIARNKQPVLELSLTTGQTIKATNDHLFLTKSNQWLQLQNLKVGDEVYILNTATILPRAARPFITDFDLFGWMTGDGWFTTSCGLVFGNKDLELMPKLVEQFRRFCGVDYTLSRMKNKQTGEPDLRYQIGSCKQSIIQKFKDVAGFQQATTLQKEVPKKIFEAAPQEKAEFLRGLFSADGSWGSGGSKTRCQVRLASSSSKLLQQVQLLLLEFDIQSNINWSKPNNRNPQGVLKITGVSAIKFRDYIGFLLDYKNQAYEVPQRMHSKHQFGRIISIQPANEENVFDLVLAVNHNFVANGIVVHNCNLGSINLSHMLREDKTLDIEKLTNTVTFAVKFLNDVVDRSMYPIPEITKAVQQTRKIGLGVMGLADMFIQMGILYGSAESFLIADTVMDIISRVAWEESKRLGAIHGFYPASISPETIPNIKMDAPRRNATVISIAPTGTLSLIANCSSGIEPIFSRTYIRHTFQGSMECEHPVSNEEVFITAHDLSPEKHVKMQAIFQKHTDLGVSKTVNLPESAEVDDVARIFRLAHMLRCKGITVYRDNSRSTQVLYRN